MNEIEKFLSAASFAVAGVSQNQAKYGNMIFRKLIESGRVTYPLNPAADFIEGHAAYPNLKAVPEIPQAISVVTTPAVTEKIISDAIELGIKHIWMQPAEKAPRTCTRIKAPRGSKDMHRKHGYSKRVLRQKAPRTCTASTGTPRTCTGIDLLLALFGDFRKLRYHGC